MPRQQSRTVILLLLMAVLLSGWTVPAQNAASGEIYSVIELSFRGPQQGPKDTPARDVDFWVRFQHESGAPEYKVHGFWDGDGKGGSTGNVFKVRFTPTKPGRWRMAEVHSNAKELARQKQGETIVARSSSKPGFWLVDQESPGGRWYKRSDGSRQYIIGNTQYSFLSGYKDGNNPSGVDIAADVANNARYFKKLRFTFHPDRYPHPQEKPFLDDDGRPVDAGDYSHRPNPKWFHERGDVAVRAAFDHDLIADLILCGPDTVDSRATLRAARNNGDPAPDLSIFDNLDPGFRGLAGPGNEFVLGTNKLRQGITARLPAGKWTVTQYDVINMKTTVLLTNADGSFTFDAPDSRAALIHFKRTGRGVDSGSKMQGKGR